jgi:hypothetical protein
VLVSRVLTEEDKAAFGFSFQLDGTEARHMALYHAGLQRERPQIAPVLAHPWETAYVAGKPVPWDAEPAFARLEWLSA